MIDLANKCVLVITHEEYENILKAAKGQGYRWYGGKEVYPYPFEEQQIPDILKFYSNKELTRNASLEPGYELVEASDVIEDEKELKDAIRLVRTFAKYPDRTALADTFIESLKLLADTVESQMEEVKQMERLTQRENDNLIMVKQDNGMKPEEALKELSYDDTAYGGKCTHEVRQEAIKALQKQIPKKPIIYPVTNRADCPVCMKTVRGIGKPFGKYCAGCGQRLKWDAEPYVENWLEESGQVEDGGAEMREILFKAKRIDDGKWVEGCYQKRYDLLGSEEHFIFHADSYTVWEYAEINPSTICQYTGLKDKNGKKIWENDILMRHENPEDFVKVAFGEFGVRNIETGSITDKAIGWYYEVVPTDAISRCEPFCWPMPLTKDYIDRCERDVVGNIFDNKELLQEEY